MRALGNAKVHTRGVCHDRRYATFQDVVNHLNSFFNLSLAPDEMTDLIEYLKSL